MYILGGKKLICLISFRDFLKPLSCLLPDLKELPNRMECLYENILCFKRLPSKMECLYQRKLLLNKQALELYIPWRKRCLLSKVPIVQVPQASWLATTCITSKVYRLSVRSQAATKAMQPLKTMNEIFASSSTWYLLSILVISASIFIGLSSLTGGPFSSYRDAPYWLGLPSSTVVLMIPRVPFSNNILKYLELSHITVSDPLPWWRNKEMQITQKFQASLAFIFQPTDAMWYIEL